MTPVELLNIAIAPVLDHYSFSQVDGWVTKKFQEYEPDNQLGFTELQAMVERQGEDVYNGVDCGVAGAVVIYALLQGWDVEPSDNFANLAKQILGADTPELDQLLECGDRLDPTNVMEAIAGFAQGGWGDD